MNHGQHADITPLAKGKNVIEDLGLTEGRIVQSGAEEDDPLDPLRRAVPGGAS